MDRVAWYSTLRRGMSSVLKREPSRLRFRTLRTYWAATRTCPVGRQLRAAERRVCRPRAASAKIAASPALALTLAEKVRKAGVLAESPPLQSPLTASGGTKRDGVRAAHQAVRGVARGVEAVERRGCR